MHSSSFLGLLHQSDSQTFCLGHNKQAGIYLPVFVLPSFWLVMGVERSLFWIITVSSSFHSKAVDGILSLKDVKRMLGSSFGPKGPSFWVKSRWIMYFRKQGTPFLRSFLGELSPREVGFPLGGI